MASNFYKNFKVKKSDGSQAELSSDKDLIDLALGTIIVSSSGDEYVKVQANVFDKSNRIILSKAEIVAKYATLENLRDKIRVVSDLSQAVDNQTLYLILK